MQQSNTLPCGGQRDHYDEHPLQGALPQGESLGSSSTKGSTQSLFTNDETWNILQCFGSDAPELFEAMTANVEAKKNNCVGIHDLFRKWVILFGCILKYKKNKYR